MGLQYDINYEKEKYFFNFDDIIHLKKTWLTNKVTQIRSLPDNQFLVVFAFRPTKHAKLGHLEQCHAPCGFMARIKQHVSNCHNGAMET